MSTFSKIGFSGGSNGAPIKVAATGSPGTLIHTAVSGTTSWDEVWLWAMNTSAASVLVTVQFGGTTSPDNDVIYTVQPKDGVKCMIPGYVLQNGLVVRAYAGSSNVITVHGFVNRIAP